MFFVFVVALLQSRICFECMHDHFHSHTATRRRARQRRLVWYIDTLSQCLHVSDLIARSSHSATFPFISWTSTSRVTSTSAVSEEKKQNEATNERKERTRAAALSRLRLTHSDDRPGHSRQQRWQTSSQNSMADVKEKECPIDIFADDLTLKMNCESAGRIAPFLYFPQSSM